jgi:hypothetical protein
MAGLASKIHTKIRRRVERFRDISAKISICEVISKLSETRVVKQREESRDAFIILYHFGYCVVRESAFTI